MRTKIYQNYEELKGHTLRFGDVVVIKDFYDRDLHFMITKNCLVSRELPSSETIFDFIGVNDPLDFCSRHYGYEPSPEDLFPCAKDCDYKALTRLVVAMMCYFQGEEYSSHLQLEGKTLKYCDRLNFSGLMYRVTEKSIEKISSVRHGKVTVFDLALVEDKKTFCEECFQYHPKEENCANLHDFEALTRLAIPLFQLSEGKSIPQDCQRQ